MIDPAKVRQMSEEEHRMRVWADKRAIETIDRLAAELADWQNLYEHPSKMRHASDRIRALEAALKRACELLQMWHEESTDHIPRPDCCATTQFLARYQSETACDCGQAFDEPHFKGCKSETPERSFATEQDIPLSDEARKALGFPAETKDDAPG
jgi:hypothetical protein